MKPIPLKLRTLSPVWTGDARGFPQGLKMSGVIGGMRQAFEMLVRKHGGHTCNCTGESDRRCNFEKGKRVCPACQVFGCTGLSRAFRLNLDLPTVTPVFPEYDPDIHNRPHGRDERKLNFIEQTPAGYWRYKSPCSLDTWLAGVLGLKVRNNKGQWGMPQPGQHKEAQQYLRQHVEVAFSENSVEAKIVPLRTLEDLEPLLAYTLAWMSTYTGLGAKVRQGWGAFELPDIDSAVAEKVGGTAIRSLIERCNYNGMRDASLPNAQDWFAIDWRLKSPDIGLQWPAGFAFRNQPFLSTGFALTYRLRRFVKFYERDGYGKLPVGQTWRDIPFEEPEWDNAPWREAIAFTRALFGRDNAGDEDKHAGLVGTSHLVRADSDWRLRLSGRLPEVYAYRQRKEKPMQLDWSPKEVRDFLVTALEELLADASPERIRRTDGGALS